MSGGMMVHSASLSALPTSALKAGQPSPRPPSAGGVHAPAAPPCGTSPRTIQSVGKTRCAPFASRSDTPKPAADRGSAPVLWPARDTARGAELPAAQGQPVDPRSRSVPPRGCPTTPLPRARPASGYAQRERGGDREHARESAARLHSPDAIDSKTWHRYGHTSPARPSPGCSNPRGPPCAADGGAPAAATRAWQALPTPPPAPDLPHASDAHRQSSERPDLLFAAEIG
jgi:hypothetical protein